MPRRPVPGGAATGAGDGAGPLGSGGLDEPREWFGSPDCSWLFSEDGGFFFFEKEKRKKKKRILFLVSNCY